MAFPGQLSLYKQEYDEKAIELLKNGVSMHELALELDVHIDTIYEWIKVHPTFSESIKKGKSFSQGWWEKKGRENLDNKEFSPALWYMNMKNRFKWTDKQEDSNKETLIESLVEIVKKQQAEKDKK